MAGSCGEADGTTVSLTSALKLLLVKSEEGFCVDSSPFS